MPVLNNLRKKLEYQLPVSQAKISLWEYPLTGDMLGSMEIDMATGQPKQSVDPMSIVVSLIAEWDFTDTEGNTLPINRENVSQIPMNDFAFLSAKIELITTASSLKPEVKKNTAETSI